MLLSERWIGLPSIPKQEGDQPADAAMEDFVDQAAIEKAQLMRASERTLVSWQDLALSSSSCDFAGGASRQTRSPIYEIGNLCLSPVRSKPAVFLEERLGTEHDSSQKWWLASMALIVSLILISGLWLSLGGEHSKLKTSNIQDTLNAASVNSTQQTSPWQPIADR